MFVRELERFVYFFMDQHTHVRMCMHMPGYALQILLCLRPSVQRQIKGLQLRTDPYLRFITYANKFPYIILLTATDQYFLISGV